MDESMIYRLIELANHLMANRGHMVFDVAAVTENGQTFDRVLIGYEFGKEAEDSPMAGGAAYATGETVEEAVIQLAEQLGIK